MDETLQRVDDPFAARRRGAPLVIIVLTVAVGVVSLGIGPVEIPPTEVVSAVARRIGMTPSSEPNLQAEAVLWGIRLPRIFLGFVTGAALGLTGAVLQGAFRNRLADPQLLGIGPGAALGGAIGTALGGVQGGIAGGTALGILAALLVRRLGRRPSHEPSRFILTGVALGAALSAWVGFVVFSADRSRMPPIEFWLLGSLTGSTWRVLGTSFTLVLIGAIALLAASRTLDLLSLGEAEARHLGLDVNLVMTVLLMAVGGVVGASVGAVGVVGFVGLLIPHLMRPFAGPSHRHLLRSSALGGGLFVISADLLARTVAEPIEIPVGLITAAFGGPFFIWLIRRARSA